VTPVTSTECSNPNFARGGVAHVIGCPLARSRTTPTTWMSGSARRTLVEVAFHNEGTWMNGSGQRSHRVAPSKHLLGATLWVVGVHPTVAAWVVLACSGPSEFP